MKPITAWIVVGPDGPIYSTASKTKKEARRFFLRAFKGLAGMTSKGYVVVKLTGEMPGERAK